MAFEKTGCDEAACRQGHRLREPLDDGGAGFAERTRRKPLNEIDMAKLAKDFHMQVTVHAAKTNLSKLIEAVLAGEEVVIAKGKQPMVKIVPFPRSRFKIGVLKEQITGPGPDFFEPMDEAELALWEGGDE